MTIEALGDANDEWCTPSGIGVLFTSPFLETVFRVDCNIFMVDFGKRTIEHTAIKYLELSGVLIQEQASASAAEFIIASIKLYALPRRHFFATLLR